MFALFLLAAPAFAVDEQPDYSREGLQRIFAVDVYSPPPQPQRHEKFDWQSIFAVDWTALGTRWRFVPLPLLPPLQGSVPTTTGMPIPNPFILTGTQFAYTPRTWRDERALSSERKKVEKLIKQRAKIKVTTE